MGFPHERMTTLSLPAAKAKLIRELIRRKTARDEERAFVLEGEKTLAELFGDASRSRPTTQARPRTHGISQSHSSPHSLVLAVVAAETRLKKTDALLQLVLAQRNAPVYTCRDSVFQTLSDTKTPSGLLAIVRQPDWDEEAILKRPSLLGLYGEGLQDPANVGAIIRTALGFHLDALWLSRDSADVFNPKVVRATAGGLLKLPVFTIGDIERFSAHRCEILAAEPEGRESRPVHEITSLPPRTILAFGSEGHGLARATLAKAAIRYHIPVSPAIESLNVAASVAISAFCFGRLRGTGPRIT
jgi:TrmH family RNA methyltransferase